MQTIAFISSLLAVHPKFVYPPISGKLTYYLIEEGEIIAKWG
jgi:hypothetical protein